MDVENPFENGNFAIHPSQGISNLTASVNLSQKWLYVETHCNLKHKMTCYYQFRICDRNLNWLIDGDA